MPWESAREQRRHRALHVCRTRACVLEPRGRSGPLDRVDPAGPGTVPSEITMYRSRVGMDAQKPGLARELHKARFRAHHIKRLEEISKRTPGTGTVDNGPPYTVHLVHLKTRPKKKAILAARDAEVERANRELLRQMTKIFTTPSELIPVAAADGRGGDLGPCLSINVLCRKQELERIAAENRTWAKHLNEVSPSYNVDEWEQDRRANKKVMERLRTVRYARAKNNPEEYSRRGVKRLRRQVERTRGQAFKAGYPSIPRALSRQISGSTSVGRFGDGGGKPHRRQPKKRPELRPPSASLDEKHGTSASGVGDDAPRESDGPQLQRMPGETEGTGRDCGAEHVDFRGRRVGDQQSPPRNNIDDGQGSDDRAPESPGRAEKCRNQSEEASGTSGDDAVSQPEYSEFGDDGEEAEESDAEGEAEQQYSDFDDANGAEGQKEEQCSDSGDEGHRGTPHLPNTHHSRESGKDIAETGATSHELAANGEDLLRGSRGSHRELGGTRTQGAMGVEVESDADMQIGSGGVDMATKDYVPSADDNEGNGDNADTSGDAHGTRKGRSGVENDNASLEDDTYTSESGVSGPAAGINMATTTPPSFLTPSSPAEISDGSSRASDTLTEVNLLAPTPIMTAGDHEPAAASAASNGSPAAMSDTHDVGNVAVRTPTRPRETFQSPPEKKKKLTDELPTPQRRPHSVSDPTSCEGGTPRSTGEILLSQAAPLPRRDEKGQCVPDSCLESGATVVQSEPNNGADVEREPVEMVAGAGGFEAGPRVADGCPGSLAIDVPRLGDPASVVQAAPSAVEGGERGNSGADQGPPTLTLIPPKTPRVGGGGGGIRMNIDDEQITSPHAQTNHDESKLVQYAILDEDTNLGDSTPGNGSAEVSSTPSMSNERSGCSADGREVEQGSAWAGGELAQSSAATSIEQTPEEELQPTLLSVLPPTEDPLPSRPAARAEESSPPQGTVCRDSTENGSNASADGPAGEGNEIRLPSIADEDGVGNGANNPVGVPGAAAVETETNGNSLDNSATGVRSPRPQAATTHNACGRQTGSVDAEEAMMVGGENGPPSAMPSDQPRGESCQRKSIKELEHEGAELAERETAVTEPAESIAPLATKDTTLAEGKVLQEPTRAQLTSQIAKVGPIEASEEAGSAGASEERSPEGLDISAFGEDEAENVPTIVTANDHDPTGGRDHFGDGTEVVGDESGSGTYGQKEIEVVGTTGCTTVETRNPDTGGSDTFDPE